MIAVKMVITTIIITIISECLFCEMTIGDECLLSVKHGLMNLEPEMLYMVKLGAQSRLWSTKLLSAVDATGYGGKYSLAGIKV